MATYTNNNGCILYLTIDNYSRLFSLGRQLDTHFPGFYFKAPQLLPPGFGCLVYQKAVWRLASLTTLPNSILQPNQLGGFKPTYHRSSLGL